ncbi:MAG: hypothetical protein J5616_04600 [Bacteroidaceae bacterium]|nr:hypothetical protein [Bacteroidaceae bacterium]
MKKIFSAIMITAAAMFGISSCSTETNESAGGTAVQDMAGLWDVDIDVMELDENGNYGSEPVVTYPGYTLYTYNTNDNRSDSLYIDDLGKIWPVKLKVGCNLSDFTITGTDVINIYDDEETCQINGRVMPGAATNLHGKPNDSICVEIEFSSDPGYLYRFTGQRYTGFYE